MDKIKNLIDSYFLGNTTLEQEEELRMYFASPDIPAELKQYQAIFGYFTQEKKNDSAFEGFDDDIVPPPKSAIKRKNTLWYAAAGIAAGLALLLTLIFNNKQTGNLQDIMCEGTFVIVNGKCTDDPQKVSKVAIDAIDALLLPTNDVVDDLDNLIENTNVIDEHVDVLKHLEFPK